MDGRSQSPIKPTGILGKYQLDRLLGKGSFAKVYRAHSISDGSPVAVKIIDRPKATVADLITREVSAMQRLKHHPNILKINEVMATKSKIYLVMELAEGGELNSKIARRGRFTESASRKYFQQLVSALQFCHKHGVAHRDMKPQNLLLDRDGNLKIADFGLSALPEQQSGEDGVLKTACGTPAYTAPEVFCRPRGFAGYDGAKADSWSCGVILYVLLAGALPFDDSNFSTMYKKMYQRDYVMPTWISRPVKSIISQLLDPNPKTRLSIDDLTRFSWFRKSQQLHQPQVSLFKSDEKFQKPNLGSMNAFDIISMSSGLDLSGLFETSGKNEKRFTSTAKVDAIENRMSEVGVKLGFVVEKGRRSGEIGLGKGRVVLMIEVAELTEDLFLVDVKAVDGGDKFEKNHWQGLKMELGDLVLSWHNDVV